MSAKAYQGLAAIAGVCLVTACQSTPATHYYTLAEIVPTAAAAGAAAAPPIRVERITIPGELDRLDLVRHDSGNRLQIATFERWAAPLDAMIRTVVTADLAARLAVGSVAGANEPAVGEPRRQLYIDIREFAGDERGAVKLRATWLLQTPNKASERGSADITAQASAASADTLASAMSRALADLSAQIAATITAQPAGEKSE
ncbi:MAG TPA: PqiC family protein [Steroidobacteraceae bacterium]